MSTESELNAIIEILCEVVDKIRAKWPFNENGNERVLKQNGMLSRSFAHTEKTKRHLIKHQFESQKDSSFSVINSHQPCSAVHSK